LDNIGYADIYRFHRKNSYDITLVASAKQFNIPYGICELNDSGSLKQIQEKPEYNYLVNTGLYVLNPDVINLIPGVNHPCCSNHAAINFSER